MAHQPITPYLNLEQKRIIVAVGRSLNHSQPVAAGLALHPQLLPGPAPERDKPGLERLRVTPFIQKAEHQHLARLRVLDDAWDQAIHLCKINLNRVNHLPLSWFILIQIFSTKKARSRYAR